MEFKAPVGSHMLKWLEPRNRKGQQFYNGVAKLARIARKRSYSTPVLFLVIKHYADRFGIVDYINRIIDWDEKQWKISPGILGLSIIYLCFLSEDGRIPLYKIPDHLRGLDLTLLFGQPFHPEDFNDDLYATFLERLGEIGSLSILAGITDQVYRLFNMPQSSDLNSDTTSHVMYGEYPDHEGKDCRGLVITNGHSKDHRPDRKQLKTGLIVDGNGVVRLVCVLNGNESDSTWNTKAIKELKKRLGGDIDKKTITADSKFVSLPNLREVNSSGKPVKFISLVPASFFKKLSTKVRTLAYEKGDWVDLGKCCQNLQAKDRATYTAQSFDMEIEGNTYRLLAVKTTSSDSTIQHRLETEQDGVIAITKDAFSKSFACVPDAEDAIKKFQKKTKNAYFKASLVIVPIEKEKQYRGKKPEVPREKEIVTKYEVQLRDIIPDVQRIEQFKRSEESFILITNVPHAELSDRDILVKYKSQGVVERSFSRLKRPMMANTLFLKKPGRIEGLMALVYVALLFQSIMQAMARHRAKVLGELPKIKYAKRKLDGPTYDLVTYLLTPFEVLSSEESMEVSCLVPELEEHLNLLLHLVDAEAC